MTFDPLPRLLALRDALGELLFAAGLPERTRSLSTPFRFQVSIPAAGLSAIRAPIVVQAAPGAGLRLRLSIEAGPPDASSQRTVEISAEVLAGADAVTFNFAPLPSTLPGETLLELTFESTAAHAGAGAGSVAAATSPTAPLSPPAPRAPPALRLLPTGRPALLFGHGAAGAVTRAKRPPLLSRDNWIEAGRLLRREGPAGLAARVLRRLTRPPTAPPAPWRDRYPEWLAAHAVAGDISITSWRDAALGAGSPSFAVAILPGTGDAAASLASVDRQLWPAAQVMDLSAAPGAAGTPIWPASAADYLVPLVAGDLLVPHALLRFAAAAGEAPALITADEDLLVDGRRCDPFFKPGLTLSRLRCEDYIAGAAAFRSGDRFAGEALQSWPGVLWDAALRRAEVGPVRRVEDVLLSRGGSPRAALGAGEHAGAAAAEPRLPLRPQAPEDPDIAKHSGVHDPATVDADARSLLRSAARRAGWGDVEPTPGPAAGTWRIAPRLEGEPLVSILIPFRDKPEILERALDSIAARSTWKNRELVLIDNGSREPATLRLLDRLVQTDRAAAASGAADISITSRLRVLPQPGPFNFARINNAAAREARGEWLLFLNNDVEVISPSWIEALLEQAVRPEVGAVGARLLFPEGFVQHAGVVLGLGGIAGHPGRLMTPASGGYHGSFDVVHDYSAATGACLLVRRSLFLDAGGFDEERLAIGFNDVDFCLRLRARGLLVVYTPFAELVHHESLSRGPRVDDAEVATMRQRWGALLDADPFYNSNLSLQRDDFEVKP